MKKHSHDDNQNFRPVWPWSLVEVTIENQWGGKASIAHALMCMGAGANPSHYEGNKIYTF